jgi:hypothetical protein
MEPAQRLAVDFSDGEDARGGAVAEDAAVHARKTGEDVRGGAAAEDAAVHACKTGEGVRGGAVAEDAAVHARKTVSRVKGGRSVRSVRSMVGVTEADEPIASISSTAALGFSIGLFCIPDSPKMDSNSESLLSAANGSFGARIFFLPFFRLFTFRTHASFVLSSDSSLENVNDLHFVKGKTAMDVLCIHRFHALRPL